MADNTYPLCYQKQGSTEWIIQSSGLLTVESGGKLSMDGSMDVSGDIDMEVGASMAMSTDANITWPVTGATSSASGSETLTTLTNNGLSFITTSGDVRKLTLDTPVAGCVKRLFFTDGSTGSEIYISAGTAGLITTGGDSTAHLLIHEGTTNYANSASVTLWGKSTDRWVVDFGGHATDFIIASTSS